MLYARIADSLHTRLPYPAQMQIAFDYFQSHQLPKEQAEAGLFLGRSLVTDNKKEDAMPVYLVALQSAILTEQMSHVQRGLVLIIHPILGMSPMGRNETVGSRPFKLLVQPFYKGRFPAHQIDEVLDVVGYINAPLSSHTGIRSSRSLSPRCRDSG